MSKAPASARASAFEMDSEQRLRVLRRVRYAHLTQDQFNLLVCTCRERGLNPWMDHLWVQSVPGISRNELVVMAKITALRSIARDAGDYAGQIGPAWCGTDGKWKRFWPDGDPPVAARVGILREGLAKPIFGTVYWQEAAVLDIDEHGNPRVDKEGAPVLSKPWQRQPRFMLAKVAEAHALRRAYPERLSGLYTSDEMPRFPRGGPRREPIRTLSPEAITIEEDTPATMASLQSRLIGETDMSLQQVNDLIAEYRNKYPRLFAPEDKRPFCAVLLRDIALRAEPIGAGA